MEAVEKSFLSSICRFYSSEAKILNDDPENRISPHGVSALENT